MTNSGKLAGLLVLLTALTLAVRVQAEPLAPQMTPELVEIGAFFQGKEVAVTGQIPPGAEAVVEVLGPTSTEKLMRKGRRGPLWMNVGELDISGAPSLYMVLTTAADLLSDTKTEGHWGFGALAQHITFSGEIQENDKAKFREQFLELKKSEKLYAAFPGALKVSRAEDGKMKVAGTFPLPANVKPATYQVCLTVVRQGQVVSRQCADLTVQMVGFPALLMSMAYEHGAIYGILAVLIAILTGFSMGYLFKGGGGH